MMSVAVRADRRMEARGYGHIADSVRAPERSVRTVGFSTDGHGRAALASMFRLDVQGGGVPRMIYTLPDGHRWDRDAPR